MTAVAESLEAFSTFSALVCGSPYPIDSDNYGDVLVPKGGLYHDTGVVPFKSASGLFWNGWYAFSARVNGNDERPSRLSFRLCRLGDSLQRASEKIHDALDQCQNLCQRGLLGHVVDETWEGHAKWLEKVLPDLKQMEAREGANDRVAKLAGVLVENYRAEERGVSFQKLDSERFQALLTQLPQICSQVELLQLQRMLEHSLPLAAFTHLLGADVEQPVSDQGLDAWIRAVNEREIPVGQLHRLLRYVVGFMNINRQLSDEHTARLEYELEQRGCSVFKQHDPAHQQVTEPWGEGELVNSELNAARAGIDTVAKRHQIPSLRLTCAAMGRFRDGAVLQPRLRKVVDRPSQVEESSLVAELKKVTEKMPVEPLRDVLHITNEGMVVWALSSSKRRDADFGELEEFVHEAAGYNQAQAANLMKLSGLLTGAQARAAREEAALQINFDEVGRMVAQKCAVEAQAATEKAKIVAAGYLEELGVVSRLPEGIARLLAAKVTESYPALEED